MIGNLIRRYASQKETAVARSAIIHGGLSKAIEAEKRVVELLRHHPKVIGVWRGKRIPVPESTLGQGEIDVIALTTYGDVFVLEVKNWVSIITESEGDVVQQRLQRSGRSTPVVPKLQKKADCLRRYLSAATNAKWLNIQPLVVLANENANPTDAVLALNKVATMRNLSEKIDLFMLNEDKLSDGKIDAIINQIEDFNRFDSLLYGGGKITSGDITHLPWPRDKYQSISITMERGLFKTLLMGPKYLISGTRWDGRVEELKTEIVELSVEFNIPWSRKKRNCIPLTHLSEIHYGGRSKINCIQTSKSIVTENSSNLNAQIQDKSSNESYSKGEILYDRKVLAHLGEKGSVHGLLIELQPKARPGRLNTSHLGFTNPDMFNYFYAEGKTIDVEIFEIRNNGDVILIPKKN
jgi:hypothetical protein